MRSFCLPKSIEDEMYKKHDLWRYERQINYFKKHLRPRKDSKVLEIGGGEGITLSLLNLNGYDAYGIDPQEKYIKHAKPILKANHIDQDKIKQGFSENIPFPDNHFDYIISFQVLEHVDDLSKTFQEIERVLKPGGKTLQMCPSYNSFREGHYKVLMLPFMSKTVFKRYIWILKKIFFWSRLGPKIDYIDTLNFITPQRIEEENKKLKKLEISDHTAKIIKSHQFSKLYKKSSWGKGESFRRRIAKKSLILLNRIGLANILINYIIRKRYYPHLYIIGTKANNNE